MASTSSVLTVIGCLKIVYKRQYVWMSGDPFEYSYLIANLKTLLVNKKKLEYV